MPPRPAAWSSSSFEAFFEEWLVRQEHYLDELLSAQSNSEQELQSLVSRVLSHYQEYYEAKSVVTQHDVLLVYSPTWFSALERSFFWIAGFKPALVFRLLGNAVRDLTQAQGEMVERLKGSVAAEEDELEREVAVVQESIASPQLLEVVIRAARLVDGERNEADDVLQVLKNSMRVLVQRADRLRIETAQRVVEILSPAQGVRLLADAARLQLRVRDQGVLLQQPRNPAR